MTELVDTLSKRITNECKHDKCSFTHCISAKQIHDAIVKLKSYKGDGSTGQNSCHLIHMTPVLHGLLAKLISAMFSHGHVPDQIRLSTILPIVKNKQASLNMSDNYRGIALFSI